MKKRSEATLSRPETNLKNRTERLVLIIITLLLSAAFVSTSKAESSIDPVAQIYFVHDVDQAGPLKLTRVYSSASSFRGQFGTGWCSELDARIRIYASNEIRYRGCDTETAAALDARVAALTIQRGNFGFRRQREDGVTQIFSRAGFLERLIRPDGDIRILRDEQDRMRELIVKASRSSGEKRILISTYDSSATVDVDLALVTSIDHAIFQYKDAMLVRTEDSRYSYDEDSNLTVRLSGAVSETIEYDVKEDRVNRITRSAGFGRERLLLAIVRTGKSNEGAIELKIEVERGAEMHPVRILYDRETRRLSLEGDRDVARMILKWLRA